MPPPMGAEISLVDLAHLGARAPSYDDAAPAGGSDDRALTVVSSRRADREARGALVMGWASAVAGCVPADPENGTETAHSRDFDGSTDSAG
jgi:hypothetical protein